MNDKAILLLKDDKIEWITLNGLGMSRYISVANLEITENGEIKSDFIKRKDGHFGIVRRMELIVDKEQVIKKLQEENEGLTIDSFEIKNLKDPSLLLEEHVKGTVVDKVTMAGDMMYFNPCLFEKYTENPFKIESREYPVDFGYPWENRIVYTIVIPQGWKPESIPAPLSIKLPDNEGKFYYSVQQVGDKLIFSESIMISSPLIFSARYSTLKEFFKQIVAKQQEQIVLKKM